MKIHNNFITYRRGIFSQKTAKLFEKIVKRGGKSRLFGWVMRFFAKKINRANLRNRLKEGAIANASRDLNLVEE